MLQLVILLREKNIANLESLALAVDTSLLVSSAVTNIGLVPTPAQTIFPASPITGPQHSRIYRLIISGAADIIIEIPCTMYVMPLNHPETTTHILPIPARHNKSMEKLSSTIFSGPWCQTCWGPLQWTFANSLFTKKLSHTYQILNIIWVSFWEPARFRSI